MPRGRKPVKSRVSAPLPGEGVVEKLKAEGDPKVQYLQDLEQVDTFKVEGVPREHETGMFYEKDIEIRRRQGWEICDFKGVTSRNFDGSKRERVWESEGAQASMRGRGLVLMTRPKDIGELRDKYKREERSRQRLAAQTALKREQLQHTADQLARILPENDEFLKGLRRKIEERS